MVDALEVDAVATVDWVVDSGWFRHFLRPFQKVSAGPLVITALIHYLGDDCRVGFLDVRQPSPNV